MKKRNLIVAALVIVALFQSCKKKDDIVVEPASFTEIENIVSSFQGNRESDIVIVNTQGGPITEMEDSSVKDIMKVSNTENVLWVNVHQAQTLNPQKFKTKEITFEQAKKYDAESVAHLKKVVTYFKEKRHKKVYVLGISFGAFMAQELIAKHGIDVADKYCIMVGRLNIAEKFWNAFSKGKGGGYTYDATGNFTIKLYNTDNVEEKNMFKLAAGLGHKRYMSEWNTIATLAKVTYIYGDRDKQVGGLTTDEANFLNNKGAKVLLKKGGNHGDAVDFGIAKLKTIFAIE